MRYAACFLLALCSIVNVWAQATGGTSGSAGGTTGSGGGTGGTGTGSTPTSGRTSGTIVPATPTTSGKTNNDIQRPIFISGKVTTDDGSPVPPNITIQRVCSGAARSVAYTDAKGRFSLQWGQTNGVLSDASESGFGARSSASAGFGSAQSAAPNGMGADPFGTAMINCELRANIAGYRSESVSLFTRNSMENPDIGIILIHRLANVEGSSVSATSFLAPKDAKKAYEQGLQALLKNKNDDAAKDFEKAVDSYPKYAEAWMNLGKVRIMQHSYEPARNALLKAIEADAKLVSPYVELGLLAAQEQKWEDSSRFLDRAVRLDPIDFPQAWYADAVANFNLKRYDAAEKSAREALKLDPKHANPRSEYLLGLVLYQKRDFAAAATELKTYLQLSPDGPDAAAVKTQVSELEKALQAAGQPASEK
jgi:tetratricopeptide (TPR) repeat protein